MGPGKARVLNRLLSEQDGVAILDGGLATELENRGADLTDSLWSARCLIENPGLVRQVHLDYFRAGADIVSSCSYQATFEGFRRKGINAKQAEELMRLSVRLACEARDLAQKERQVKLSRRPKGLVAASLGCYGASLANGAEYTGDYGDASIEDLMEFHRHRLRVMARSGADVLAFETVPCLLEAEAIARLLDEEALESGEESIPAWVSFSCRDERHVSHGETLAECVRALESCARVAAVGINCTPPRYIDGLVTEAHKVTSKPIVVYPNSGESWDGERKEWVPSSGVSDDDFVSMVPAWRDAGAKIIGGCCRTSPHTIRSIAQVLKRSGSSVTAGLGA